MTPLTMSAKREREIRADVEAALSLVPQVKMHDGALALVGAGRDDIRLILQSRVVARDLLAELDAVRALYLQVRS